MERIITLLFLGVLLACDTPGQGHKVRDNAEFVASSQGQVYYSIQCDTWKRLSSANLRFFRTPAEAEAAGYRPSQSRGCAPHLEAEPLHPVTGGELECVVARIVDGDTFYCQGGTSVRLLIADTDEAGQSVYADSARALLESVMPPGTRVRLSIDVAPYDRYRRVLAYVYAGDVFVNRELARRGLAHAAPIPPNVRHLEEIRAAVDSARRERVGIWSGSAFECTPLDYRAGRCR